MDKKELAEIYKRRIEIATDLRSKERDEIEIIKLEVEITCFKHFVIALNTN